MKRTTTPLRFVGEAEDRDDFVLRCVKDNEQHNTEVYFPSLAAYRRFLRQDTWLRQEQHGSITRLFPSSYREAEAADFCISGLNASYQPTETYRFSDEELDDED